MKLRQIDTILAYNNRKFLDQDSNNYNLSLIMFEKTTYEISDRTFLDRFYSQNVFYKVTTNLILKARLLSDEKLSPQNIKPLYLQILENYVGITETILMFLHSLIEKKKNPEKSLLHCFAQIFIKEEVGSQWNTLNILDNLKNKNDSELFDLFGLKKPDEILATLDEGTIIDLKNQFGNKENFIQEASEEFSSLVENIEKALSNRIENAKGEQLPFYKIYNKLKHGAQYIDEPETDKVYVISKVNSVSSNNSKCEVFYLECNVKDAVFLTDQSKIIAQSLENLLLVISPTFAE